MRRNTVVLLVILAIFALSLAVVLPIQKGALFGRGVSLGLDLRGGIHLVYRADLTSVAPGEESKIMDGVISVISNRINPLGVTEPVIERQGEDRIVVELPGLSVTEQQKERLGRTALLEFREQVTDANGQTTWVPVTGTIDGEARVLTSRYFKENTYVDRDSLGRILLAFEWDTEGSRLSEQITSRMIGKPLGIFEGDEPLLGEDGLPIAPVVQAVITNRGQIEGLSLNESTDLSAQLNAGRLPVPLVKVYEQTISPVLGADFVALSVKAGLIGLLVIMLFMILYYRLPGLIASLALVFYGVLVMAIFKMIPVTLTLSGLGGFILS
ncbi:MAG: protein translocase subunit SecD, partial [Dehalococcoidia bacterium]|nr:protein translocase subunit SecD [Dehalococcoidia bacterium]